MGYGDMFRQPQFGFDRFGGGIRGADVYGRGAPQVPGGGGFGGGGGVGGFMTGPYAQLIGGALGGIGQYMAAREATGVRKDELALQRQKYDDERSDRRERLAANAGWYR